MIIDQLGRFFAFDFTLLTMFWYSAVIEVPRFLIGALYMAWPRNAGNLARQRTDWCRGSGAANADDQRVAARP